MGYDSRMIEVHAYVSRHNSERDAEDDAAFEAMRAEIAEIVAKYEGTSIRAWMG